jgi:hypothetical protein
MTRDSIKGMSLEEFVHQINAERRLHGLSTIAISTSPSSSGKAGLYG